MVYVRQHPVTVLTVCFLVHARCATANKLLLIRARSTGCRVGVDGRLRLLRRRGRTAWRRAPTYEHTMSQSVLEKVEESLAETAALAAGRRTETGSEQAARWGGGHLMHRVTGDEGTTDSIDGPVMNGTRRDAGSARMSPVARAEALPTPGLTVCVGK
jgi:hypothetical protein